MSFLYLETKPITRNQEKFYQTLFSNYRNYVEIRLINKGGQVEKQKFLTVAELMNYTTPKDINVYVGIYERRHKGNGKITNCTVTNAIYLDFDDTTLEAVKYTIDAKGIPLPTMIVNSGHGYHVYWLLDESVGHEAKPIISKLQQVLNADAGAVDIARVLRIPDTMNVKGEPVASELLELNSNRTTLKQFESVLGVNAVLDPVAGTGSIKELAATKHNGLNNMAQGVSEGERNFCIGRILQTLKRLNYTRQQATDIVFRWNTLNKPQKPANELKKDIRTYLFDERYKYDGKEFAEERLQELNERFIDNETVFFVSENSAYHTYDNDLLGDKFHKISGLTFAVLSIIKMEEAEGINLTRITKLTKRNTRDKTLLETLDFLFKANHVYKETRKGKPTVYTFKEKPFSDKRGFTSVPKLLHKLYIESCNAKELEQELNTRVKNKAYERLNETRYKLLILLESYAYDSKREVYPTDRTLADRMRIHVKTVKRNLDWLEDNQFIKIVDKEGSRHIRLIYA